VLTLTSIRAVYAGSTVVADVSLRVPTGAVTGLLGPSGSGKTTLLQIAAGLRRPDSGQVTNGFARTAVVFQDPRLLPWRTARDNIAFALKAQGVERRQRRQTAMTLGERLGLCPGDLDKFPHELSGGMRQRVAIGRALAVQPDLLLLDEPFSALDVGLRRELQDLVRGLIEERRLAALFVTHDVTEAVRIADNLLVLSSAPSRIVHRQTITEPFARRDDAFVFETAARFLRTPAVADAFRT